MVKEDFEIVVPASGNQFQAAGSMLEKIKEWLAKIAGPLPTKEEFLRVVGEAFDTYVAPIDIPQVPNLIEPRIDAMMRIMVLVAAGKLYDRFAA